MKKILGRISLTLLIIFTIFLIYQRDHFAFGTLLSFLRWPLFVLFGTLLIINLRQGQPFKLTLFMLGLLSVIGEWYWIKLNNRSLQAHDSKLQGKDLSILSYNLYFRNQHPESIIMEIQEADPDVIVVQELTTHWDSLLRTRLKKYPYYDTKPLRNTYGLGTYSKFPLTKTEFLAKQPNKPYAQFVEIDFGDKNILLCNVHLASPAWAVENPNNFFTIYEKINEQRKNQLIEIEQYFNQENYQQSIQILAGDLNVFKLEPIYRDLLKNWLNLYNEKGSGLGTTFPNAHNFPNTFITLDYILFRGETVPLNFSVLDQGSSDHFGIMGKLGL
ncbi:endonuclease/exonuclease/phosphatase family protein [Fulvivirgaceae bacterium BMA10]|uniref:Endonuclease/exonuclease/phosphatase family protein n=1 Tax=Splendidivirga corallicola TaxID=3051826 RepID=A0ABT8KL23_9BACT|nr:endonuclease/exonuclease/phosphatase family protein [Fulvivirgaceae bacterium BMA10]